MCLHLPPRSPAPPKPRLLLVWFPSQTRTQNAAAQSDSAGTLPLFLLLSVPSSAQSFKVTFFGVCSQRGTRLGLLFRSSSTTSARLAMRYSTVLAEFAPSSAKCSIERKANRNSATVAGNVARILANQTGSIGLRCEIVLYPEQSRASPSPSLQIYEIVIKSQPARRLRFARLVSLRASAALKSDQRRVTNRILCRPFLFCVGIVTLSLGDTAQLRRRRRAH